MGINEIPLITREDIIRRIEHLKGEPNIRRPTQVTIRDMANWMGVTREMIKLHLRGREPISDTWQLLYSHFFHLIDTGQLVLKQEGDPNDRRTLRKVLVRVPKPDVLPKRPVRPHIEFPSMRLRFT